MSIQETKTRKELILENALKWAKHLHWQSFDNFQFSVTFQLVTFFEDFFRLSYYLLR